LLDPVLVEFSPEDDDRPHAEARVEFPGSAKRALDEIRQSVTPTLKRHHQVQTIDSRVLEMAEVRLSAYPEERESIENTVFLETILVPLEKCGLVRLEHLRPSGKAMRPREGTLVSRDEGRIVFRRPFSNGRYDGLDIEIHPGDYGLTEIEEGQWFVKHTYFRKDGKLIGEYYNINSPVELYPYGARYMDLEIDVIRRAGEGPFIVDEERLAILTQQGCIGPDLERKAMDVAEELLTKLRD